MNSWKKYTMRGNKVHYVEPSQTGKVPGKIKKYVKKAIKKDAEMKQATFAGTNATISSTVGTVYYLTVPAIGGPFDLGTKVDQRIGNRIRIYQVDVNFNVYLNNAQASAIFRAMLFVDKDADGYAPLMNEIITSVTAGQSVTAPIREQGKTQYRVLKQKFHNFNQPAGVVGLVANAYHAFRFTYKFKNGLLVDYTNAVTLGSVADVQKNNICMAMFSDAAGLTNGSIMYSLRYTDE